MTGLVSKWATDVELVTAAKQQDVSKKPHTQKATNANNSAHKVSNGGHVTPSVKSTSPHKPLPSKWADVASVPDVLPTPPSSSGSHKRNDQDKRRTNSGGGTTPEIHDHAGSRKGKQHDKEHSNHFEQGDRRSDHKQAGRRNSRGYSEQHEGRRNSRGHSEQHEGRQNSRGYSEQHEERRNSRGHSEQLGMSALGESFAKRLGVSPGNGQPGKSPAKEKAPKAANGSKKSSHERQDGRHRGHTEHEREGGERSDSTSKPEMSAAGRALALRIGVPPISSKDGSSSSRSQKSDDAKKHANTDAAGSKYLTPKQKRALAEQEAQAKLKAQQALEEAKLKAEVQMMFEKMSDKSTSWADLDDDE